MILAAWFFVVRTRRMSGSMNVVRNAGMPDDPVVTSVGWASMAIPKSCFHSGLM